MKKILFVLLTVVFLSAPAFSGVEFSEQYFEELAQSKNKIPEITVPAYERFELGNGLIVFLIENHELPVVEISGYIKGGRSHETPELAGITDFMIGMMSTGTANMSEQEMNEYKGLHGTYFGITSKRDYLQLSGNALIEDSDELISLMADILMNPDFKAPYYQRKMMELYQGLSMARTQDPSLLDMVFFAKLYGDHPYDFDTDIDLQTSAVQNITPEKLQQYYDETIAPNTTIIGIAGDFKNRDMKKKIKDAFSEWQNKGVTLPHQKIIPQEKNYGRVFIINKPDATQAKIVMGYDVYDNRYEKYVEHKIADMVYGSGSFECRLMDLLRVKKGYAYDARSSVSVNNLGGDYTVRTEVKPESAYNAYRGIIDEMRAIKDEVNPISAKELYKTVNFFNALLPKFYSDKTDIINDVMYNMEITRRGADWMNKYIAKYNNMTAGEAQLIFEKKSRPDDFITVILGQKDLIAPQFEEQGISVEIIEI